MSFKNEIPLRGWKEIKPMMNVADKRTAKNTLEQLDLLIYHNGRPILFFSEYQTAIKNKKG